MSGVANKSGRELYEFGPFRVDAEKELLLRAGQPVTLTPKTFQILLTLVRRSGELVTKDEIMKAVWPDTFVEETNLTRNIFSLRKALGESPENQYIITVSGGVTGSPNGRKAFLNTTSRFWLQPDRPWNCR